MYMMTNEYRTGMGLGYAGGEGQTDGKGYGIESRISLHLGITGDGRGFGRGWGFGSGEGYGGESGTKTNAENYCGWGSPYFPGGGSEANG